MEFLLLLGWLVYGILVGLIAKSIYRGNVPSGFLSTLSVGVAGSFVGGFVKFLLTGSGNPFQASGILLGVFGGIFACYIHKKFLS